MGETTIDLGIQGLDQVKVIGSGGSAVVYRALRNDVDEGEPSEVAIKVLKSSWDPNAIRRFEREQRAMRTLAGSPGFVPILETGTTSNGASYFMMPFYEGGSLHEKISRHGPIDWPRAFRLIEQVATTVDIAHQNDVLHRDLKPGNILLSATGDAHVTDFGISLISSESADGFPTTSTAFTPAYSPPESFTNAEKPSAASDVYGLAATLWALLAGHAPFKAPGEQAAPATVFGRVAMQQVGDLRDRVPSPICRFIEESMAKEPGDRPQSVTEFLDRLRQAREDSYRGVYAPRLELNTPTQIVNTPEPDYVKTKVVAAPVLAFDLVKNGPDGSTSSLDDETASFALDTEKKPEVPGSSGFSVAKAPAITGETLLRKQSDQSSEPAGSTTKDNAMVGHADEATGKASQTVAMTPAETGLRQSTAAKRIAKPPAVDYGPIGLASKPSWPWPALLAAMVVVTTGLFIWSLTRQAVPHDDIDVAPPSVVEPEN